jgi:hypothetical protein
MNKKILIILVIIIMLAGTYFIINNVNWKRNGGNSVSNGSNQSDDGNKSANENKPANTGGNTGDESGKTNTGAGFNLVFKYGVGGKNILDTFENRFTKDMISDPSITVDFKLTQAETESIRQKINELDLFNKESKIQPEGGMLTMQTPCSNYYLKVQDTTVAKEIGWDREVSWDNCSGEISAAYGQFSDFMINLIESKKEFKILPEAQGGYM